MKQFAYNLAYKCETFEESMEITKSLQGLGCNYLSHYPYKQYSPFLITNTWGKGNGFFGFNQNGSSVELIDSKELFLALGITISYF